MNGRPRGNRGFAYWKIEEQKVKVAAEMSTVSEECGRA
jgi:hypothetical protein